MCLATGKLALVQTSGLASNQFIVSLNFQLVDEDLYLAGESLASSIFRDSQQCSSWLKKCQFSSSWWVTHQLHFSSQLACNIVPPPICQKTKKRPTKIDVVYVCTSYKSLQMRTWLQTRDIARSRYEQDRTKMERQRKVPLSNDGMSYKYKCHWQGPRNY